VVAMTQLETEEMLAKIKSGELPRDAYKQYLEAEARNVFGHDAKKDANGNWIEQGHGAPSHPTRNSLEAYKRWGKEEPHYHEHLARMEKELAEYEAKQAAKRATRAM
jgi:hypothetical protein